MSHDAARSKKVCTSQTSGNRARLPALTAGARGRLEIDGSGHRCFDEAGHAEVAEEAADTRGPQGRVRVALRTGDLVPVILDLLQTALAEGVKTEQDLRVGVCAAAQRTLCA